MKRLLLIVIVSLIFSTVAFAGHQGIYTGNCVNCHIPNLITQHGGFNGTDCAICHSSQDATVMATISKGIGGGIISCADCHGLATHTQKHGTYFQGWTAYPGVVPVRDPNAGAWTQGTGFTYLPNTDPYNKPAAQYQVCYACHSYYSLGPSPNGDGVYDIVGPSGFNLTDQAMEFNPKNKSAHPVEATLNNQTGSYTPKALASSQMLFPWTQVGNQILNCSHCHEVGNVTGPQGSSYQFTLNGTRKYWPRNKTNGRLWTLGDLKNNQNNWKGDLFCANCHTLYNGNFMNKVHDKGDHNDDLYPDIGNIPDSEKYRGAPCVMCHLAIPHGAKRSRFIVYYDEPYPYQYKNTVTTGPDKWFSSYHNGMMGTMTGFKKSASPGNYDKKNCYIPKTETYGGQSGQPRWGCGDHESKDMTYDP